MPFTGPFSGAFSCIGVGHAQVLMMLKNLDTMTEPVAAGYSWQTLATSMAQATPPGKPMILAYMARPGNQISTELPLEQFVSYVAPKV